MKKGKRGLSKEEQIKNKELFEQHGILICCSCHKEKDTSCFYKNSGRRGGKFGYDRNCKECRSAITKKFHKKLGREEYSRRFKTAHLRINYGITLDQYNEMLKKQNGVCCICKGAETYSCPQTKFKGIRNTGFSVDHNHTTGIIRGLLCRKCNSAIGYFKEDPLIMERAIKYLYNKLDEQIPNGIQGNGRRTRSL